MSDTRQPNRSTRRVAALAEALILPGVLAALAAGAGMGVMSARADAELRTARSTAQNLAQLAEAYQMLRGADVCPSVAQIEDSKLLRGGLKAEDPWGTRYEVVCKDRRVHVRSLGPDRRPNTADDIAPE